jgi:hypothetical protein
MMIAAPTRRQPGPGACLDQLLASRFLPNRWARRIFSAQDLPLRLQRRVEDLPAGSEWRAYSDEDRVFFALARMHLPATARESELALDVYFLDREAAAYSAGVWAHDIEHGWWLDAVLEASYDCEQGWWPDAQNAPAAADETPAPAAQLAAPRAGVRQMRQLSTAAARTRKPRR